MVESSKKFDVFLSFRGEDTRKKFTSHLYEALSKKVLTFIDDTELERGEEISSALIKAIEESDVSVVIFSKHYASSKWCLNELLKILECKKDQGQIVIPIFYEIEPSHVRNQTGSYNQAFEKHERHLRHNKDMLQKWKYALTEASNLSGWDSQNFRMESTFIKDIVEDVLTKLNRRQPFEVNKELVGIEKNYEKMESLLKIGSNDVRYLGVWGMGGIGKSTLAKYLYAKLCPQFERHCFFENIREESTRYGLNVVRCKLFSTLSELCPEALYVDTQIFKKRLAHERSLIVLDDVATLEQAETLNVVNNCLGEGSRVIITTRDKQICSQFDECEIYEVEGLSRDESLQLFCMKAFGAKIPKDGYEYLSKMATLYCRGNPLALNVLGANFRTKKSKEAWKSELEKLKKIPNGRIHDVLQSSFDDLDSTQQDIFLDIACISNTDTTIYDRDLYYLAFVWNACNFFAESGLEVLLYKALIYFEEDEILMHALLEEMGKEIVKKESIKDPGRRSRLWDPKEVYDVLKYKKGAEFVEVIEFDVSKIEDLYLSSDSFKSMTNLRYLHITYDKFVKNKCKIMILNNVHLLEGLEWLSDKLRHLYWKSFPLESLPSTFCAEWLVQLSMKYSKLKKLWDGIQRLDNLIILILDYSKDLIEIPDLSRAPNLQLLSVSYCESLCQLHPSVLGIPKLRELYLKACKKIVSLKTNIRSKSLQILDLSYCSSLVEFPVTSEEMMVLKLGGTSIHTFSSSIWCNKKLSFLNLSECKKLNVVWKKLPNDTGLGFLTKINLTGCTEINSSILSFILERTPSLKYLFLRYCYNLESLPDMIQNIPKLKILDIDECWKLKSLPKLPATLQELRATNCDHLNTNSFQRSTLDNMLHRAQSSFNNGDGSKKFDDYFFFPGSQIPSQFHFHTADASITIPPIPRNGLSGFAFCLILSNDVEWDWSGTQCKIHEHTTKAVASYFMFSGRGALGFDHVLLCCGHYNSTLVNAGNKREGDYYHLSFEFRYKADNKKVISTKGIKGCGVIPIYDYKLKDSFLFDRKYHFDESQSSAPLSVDSDQHLEFDIDDSEPSDPLSLYSPQYSEFDIRELEYIVQISDDFDRYPEFDTDELQHRSTRADVRFSTNENEDGQQQLLIPLREEVEELNDKSSCSCSIGVLLKHMLEESKRLFLLFLKQR